MPDKSESLAYLPGSERAPLAGATDAGPLDTAQRAELTLMVRRRPGRRRPGQPGAHEPRPGDNRRLPGFPPGQGAGDPGRPGTRPDPSQAR